MNLIRTDISKCLQFGNINIKIVNLNYTNVTLYISFLIYKLYLHTRQD